jgi:hypothetical protein
MNHVIIYSHGWGVRKDDKGLLTSIAAALPEAESILFDYNTVDDVNNTLTVPPLSQQAVKLNKVIKDTRDANPNAVIDLICHSQGAVVAALAQPLIIRKTIFLAPPVDMAIERSLERYKSNPEAEINLLGISKLPSLGGYIRIVPAEYWTERINMNVFDLYNKYGRTRDLLILSANQDQILGKVNLSPLLPKIKRSFLDGDHNFSGPAMQSLIEVIRNYLMKQ